MAAFVEALRVRGDGGNHRWLWEPLLVFGVTRACLYLLAYVGQVLLPRREGTGLFLPAHVIDGWYRWDAVWYVGIAEKGYWLDPTRADQSVAFFPLYPLLIRITGYLTGDLVNAGFLVANVSFAAALVLLYTLARDKVDAATARRTVVLLSLSPFAFYFSAIYTEATFLLLAVASFWLGERERWWLAGLVGALCALTRLVGVALAPALLLLYLRRRGYAWRTLDRGGIGPTLVPLGTLLFAAYLYRQFGDPLAFYHAAIAGWQRYNLLTSGLADLNPLLFAPGDYDFLLPLNLALAVLVLLTFPRCVSLLGPAYAVFVFCGALVPLYSGLHSLGRYVTVLFPAFVVFAHYLRDPLPFRLVLLASGMLLSLLTVLFANWYAVT